MQWILPNFTRSVTLSRMHMTLSRNLRSCRIMMNLCMKHNLVVIIRMVAVLIVVLVLLTGQALKRYSNREAQLDAVSDISHLPPAVFTSYPVDSSEHPQDIKDTWYCDVKCSVGTPCEYKDEVDLRIIVMTFDRWQSLEKCLGSVLNLDTMESTIAVDIWIDKGKDGRINDTVLQTAKVFTDRWNTRISKGRACIHTQNKNAYINGQWIDTWRPREGTKELALILEDDISISPYAYKYLKSVHKYLGHRDDIAGYTLQMEEINFFAPDTGVIRQMQGDPGHIVFLYPVLGTWGYAPHPRAWRQFQNWYHTVRPERSIISDHIQPFVPGIVPSQWYQGFLKDGSQESMWEMWHIKYTHDQKLFTAYSNMKVHSPTKEAIFLSTNRKEKGLHFDGDSGVDNTQYLLKDWDENFVNFPSEEHLVKFNYDGSICDKDCCFTTLCENVLSRVTRRHSLWQILRMVVLAK